MPLYYNRLKNCNAAKNETSSLRGWTFLGNGIQQFYPRGFHLLQVYKFEPIYI